MMRVLPLLLLAVPAFAQGPAWYGKAVESVEAKFVPSEAKPGQTVELQITVTLKLGYFTYPLVQKDKGAADMVNAIKYPTAGAIFFVGDTIDPPMPKSKAEPDLGIKEILHYTGSATYTRPVVVNPKATASTVTVTLPEFRLSVCDKDNCFPAYKLTPAATLKILDGAVPVEAKYAAEVEKALKGN